MAICGAFCMSQVPFAFESERPNGNSTTKQLPRCQVAAHERLVKWLNGNSTTVLSLNCHSVIWLIWFMVIWWLFCCQIAIRPFRLKLKCQRNLTYFKTTILRHHSMRYKTHSLPSNVHAKVGNIKEKRTNKTDNFRFFSVWMNLKTVQW